MRARVEEDSLNSNQPSQIAAAQFLQGRPFSTPLQEPSLIEIAKRLGELHSLPERWARESCRSVLAGCTFVPLMLSVTVRASMPDGAVRVLGIWLVSALSGERIPLLYRGLGGKCFIEIAEGTEMNKEKENQDSVDVDLCLGSICLGLADFLALRPGVKITFEKPASTQLMLKLGAHDFALADSEFGEKEVTITIREIVSSKPLSNKSEETAN